MIYAKGLVRHFLSKIVVRETILDYDNFLLNGQLFCTNPTFFL